MKQALSLTSGSLKKNIFLYSYPLIFTNLLQVLFNMSDIAVIGRFAGPMELGAVGSTPMIVFFVTGFIQGLGSGINSVVAYFLGSKSKKDVDESIHTAIIISFIAGVILMCCGMFFSRPVLEILNTKPELIDDAELYLKIYMIGLPAMALYNYGSALLSAAGDTKRPLIYLSISGAVNVLLNLFFVIVLQIDVAGVALATVISQCLSAVLILRILLKGTNEYKLNLKNLKIAPSKVSRILKIGIPSGLQNAIFAIANLFIQVGINSFDAITVAGISAAANADPLVYDVMNAFYVAGASFIAQNFGARNRKRVRNAYFVSMTYSFVIGLVLGIMFFVLGRQFLFIFTDNQTVVEAGILRLRVMALSYCTSALMDCTISACRGLGKTLIPSIIVILGSCVFRIAWVYTIFAYYKTVESLFLLYAASWLITAAAEIIYFAVIYKKELKNMN